MRVFAANRGVRRKPVFAGWRPAAALVPWHCGRRTSNRPRGIRVSPAQSTAVAPAGAKPSRRRQAKPSCEDCYFGRRLLCALELGEPCSTFRPDSPRAWCRPPSRCCWSARLRAASSSSCRRLPDHRSPNTVPTVRFTVLGKSPAWEDAGGACSGYLVEEGEYALLLDCGNGVFGKLRERLSYDLVDEVLISHMHADHVLDLVPFAYALTLGPGATRPPPRSHRPAARRDRQARGDASRSGAATS